MKVYAVKSPTRDGKDFLHCLSSTSPTTESETWPAGYDDAEEARGKAKS